MSLARSIANIFSSGVASQSGVNVQTFNASGTWTKPSGYGANSRVLIQAWAAAVPGRGSPLFFKFKRGESTEQDWLDKIADIKNRFPNE
jgi:hypothetical protein